MFQDPLPFPKPDGSKGVYPRITITPNSASYEKEVDGKLRTITIKQNKSNNRRLRREVRLAVTKVAEDALLATNVQVGASVYIVIDEPASGFTDSEMQTMVTDLACYLLGDPAPVDTTPILKVLAGEY